MRANKRKLNPDKMEVLLLMGSSTVLGSGCILRLVEAALTPKAVTSEFTNIWACSFMLFTFHFYNLIYIAFST